MDLFNLTVGCFGISSEKPRDANDLERAAYRSWLIARGRIGEDDPLPGANARNVVIVETLDDAGAVIRSSTIGIDAKGGIGINAKAVKAFTGLEAVRKPRKAATKPASAPEPVAAPVDAPAPVIASLPALPAEIEDQTAMTVPATLAAALDWLSGSIARNPITDEESRDVAWHLFASMALGANGGWAVSCGAQRDRKARNRGKMIVSQQAIDGLRNIFAEAIGIPAGAQIAPPAIMDAVPAIMDAPAPIMDAAPSDTMAAVLTDLAQLVARVAQLHQPAAAAVKRSPAHARAIQRAWDARRARIAQADLDRRALLAANEYVRTLELRHADQLAAAQRVSDMRQSIAAGRRQASQRMIAAARRDRQHWRTMSERHERVIAARVTELEAVRADLAKLQPLAAALSALMPSQSTAPTGPTLVASNGRDPLAAAA